MSVKKRRLGRGLDALLGEVRKDDGSGAPANRDSLREVPIDMLHRGQYQPRTHMDPDALAELALSIKARGVVQPIIARPTEAGQFEIIAGERRWRAAQSAGLETVPVLVREIADDAALAVALIENIQRENLNPIEEAAGLKRLLDEFGMTHEQVAQSIGRSRSGVTNLLRLLTLSPAVKELVEEGKLEMGHARALLALDGAAQEAAAQAVVSRQLSVRQTEQWVRKAQQAPRGKRVSPSAADADIMRLQEQLSERLGAKVSIHNKSGQGRLVIEFHSLDELDGILTRIN